MLLSIYSSYVSFIYPRAYYAYMNLIPFEYIREGGVFFMLITLGIIS